MNEPWFSLLEIFREYREDGFCWDPRKALYIGLSKIFSTLIFALSEYCLLGSAQSPLYCPAQGILRTNIVLIVLIVLVDCRDDIKPFILA